MEALIDRQGESLSIGDEVFFTMYAYHELYKGKIVRITKNRVYISGTYVGSYYIHKENVKWRVIKIK